jgi:hypothetical protein
LSGASEFDRAAIGLAEQLRLSVDICLEAAIERERESALLTREMRRLGIIGSGPRITAMFQAILRRRSLVRLFNGRMVL